MYLDLVRSGLYFNKEHEHRFVTLDGSENKLDGLVVCFTGSSSRFSGDKVEEFLENNGAKCTHSVSKKMNYLITGSKPGGSKVKKAEELGVEIITEEEFYKKYVL
jgi:DNA ligase (NAD+)